MTALLHFTSNLCNIGHALTKSVKMGKIIIEHSEWQVVSVWASQYHEIKMGQKSRGKNTNKIMLI